MLNTIILTVAAIVGLSLLLNLWRFMIGPHMIDRVIALDTMYINAIALIVILGLLMRSPLYYEGALVITASIIYFSFRESGISIKESLIVLFIFLTAPITANMLAKAALHVRSKPRSDTLNHDRLDMIRKRE